MELHQAYVQLVGQTRLVSVQEAGIESKFDKLLDRQELRFCSHVFENSPAGADKSLKLLQTVNLDLQVEIWGLKLHTDAWEIAHFDDSEDSVIEGVGRSVKEFAALVSKALVSHRNKLLLEGLVVLEHLDKVCHGFPECQRDACVDFSRVEVLLLEKVGLRIS